MLKLRPRTARLRSAGSVLLGLAIVLTLHSARAQTFADPGFVAETVTTLPPYQLVGIAWASTGTMFIWQKDGLVRAYHDGFLDSTPFLDLRGQVNTYTDRGLLGLAVDPNFAASGYVYLAYVYEGGGNPNDTGPKISRVSRVTADPANRNVALPSSEVIILDNLPATGAGHAAGTLRFAQDGTLFVSNGESATNASLHPFALEAQDIDSLRGKLLRINPDGSAPAPPQVTNPYYDGTNSIRSKVYAKGFRNPFRFDLHPVSGEPYVCDVGWDSYEEVDRVVPGGNYGWPCYEGPDPQPTFQTDFPQACGPLQPSMVNMPLYAYAPPGSGASIVGAVFYTGSVYPQQFDDNFFFSDYVNGWMRRLVLNPDGSIDQNLLFASNLGAPVTAAVGPDGMLYFTDFVSGAVRRVRYNGPVAVASATPTSGYSPLQVSFSSAGSIDGLGSPLTYFWDFADGGTSTAPDPSHTYATGAVQSYAAELTVRNSSNATSTATVSVIVGSLPPNPTIQSPADSTGVVPGETVNFSGAATDPDETLGASALHWEVLLHHNSHVHSLVGGTGFTGSFVAEYHGTDSYSYELILTATDTSGLSASTSVNLPVLGDHTAPTAPSNAFATAAGAHAIGLGWSPSSDSAGISSYRIERCTGASCTNFTEIAILPGTTFYDAGLPPQTTYRYRVRASDPTGNLSGYSNIASAQTAADPQLPAGLVAAYGFDESFGTVANDESGHGNAGSLNGATRTTDGRYGKALLFDGANDVVTVPDSSTLDLTSAMTLEAWVYPTSPLSLWKAILQKEADAYLLSASTNLDRVGFGGTFNGTCCTFVQSSNPLPANQWSHVAGTYDGATLSLYLNGTQVATQSRTGNLQVTGTPLRIGGNSYSGEFFPGRIDEVRVYSRALSASEIQSDKNTPLPEPAALSSLLAGAAGLTFMSRQSRRRQRRTDHASMRRIV